MAVLLVSCDARQSSDEDEIVVHQSLRNGQEKDQPRAFSLIVPGNASLAAADRERNLIDQLGACMWESDAVFGQGRAASSRASTCARKSAGRATLPVFSNRLTTSRITFGRLRDLNCNATCR